LTIARLVTDRLAQSGAFAADPHFLASEPASEAAFQPLPFLSRKVMDNLIRVLRGVDAGLDQVVAVRPRLCRVQRDLCGLFPARTSAGTHGSVLNRSTGSLGRSSWTAARRGFESAICR
jgi:hypothetical protein